MVQRALIFLGIFLAIAFGLLFWSVQHDKAKAAKKMAGALTELTPQDVQIIAENSLPPQQLRVMSTDAAARQEFLVQLKEQFAPVLSIAREARAQGIAEEPNVKKTLEFMRSQILAVLYEREQQEGQVERQTQPFGSITKEQADEYLKKPGVEAKYAAFEKLIEAEAKASKTPLPPQSPQQKTRQREQWAKIMLTADKARAANFEEKPEVKLQMAFQEARILAAEFDKRQAKKIEPTKEELAKYLAEHPEFDAKKQREKIDEIARRAKSGEDFAALAKEFSEDPGSKDNGGLYEEIEQGSFDPQFEAAALALEKGGITDVVETPFGYHVIKLEDKKTAKDKDGKETVTYSVRHILRQTSFRQPGGNPMQPQKPLTGEEAARAKLSEEKQKKLIDEVTARNPITLPADFTVKVPAGADALPPNELPNLPPPPTGGQTDAPTKGTKPPAAPKPTAKPKS